MDRPQSPLSAGPASRVARLAIACAALSFASCGDRDGSTGGSPPAPPAIGAPATVQVWFDSREREVGIDFVHEPGPLRYWFPEIMTGGAALFDTDGDGDLDLYLVQGGDLDPHATDRPTNRLYENRGDGTFADVTDRAGVGDDGYGMGAACGDVDGDGDVDLYVTNVGPNVLYRNEGDGTFTDVTGAAGVGHPSWSASAAFSDVDGDGDLDLFATNYVNWSIAAELECGTGAAQRDYCSPNEYKRPAMDVLYENRGDGTFADVSEEVGLGANFGNGLGVACADFDDDGRVDLYVANDGMPNQLWIQGADGRFTDSALLAGCAVNRQGAAEAGMGVAAVDLDGDGLVDLFMTHLRNESNTFYRNRGGVFEDRTSQTGLAGASMSSTGFGMGFADFDLDGRLDLFVANGAVQRHETPFDPGDPYAEPDHLFRGLEDGRFERVPRAGLVDVRCETGRAAALGDVDGDGAVDVVVVNVGAPARLLLGRGAPDRHWIVLDVLDAHGAPALGARVEIEADGRRQSRQVQAAYSYCASNDPRAHFGLAGTTRVERARVHWTDGGVEEFGPFEVDRVVSIRRGEGRGL